ncbi:hypothetical protein Leryth_026423 [Lithospermum erythrorhizon]|nr:hypothetical protein Leryth_026423 [Lithospermum erythrorhizon]
MGKFEFLPILFVLVLVSYLVPIKATDDCAVPGSSTTQALPRCLSHSDCQKVKVSNFSFRSPNSSMDLYA